jgi:membrane-bound ClpP family serine protease
MEDHDDTFWDRFSFRRRNRVNRKAAQQPVAGEKTPYAQALSSFRGHGNILFRGEICDAFCAKCRIFKGEQVKVVRKELFFYVVEPAEWENGQISLDRTPPAT